MALPSPTYTGSITTTGTTTGTSFYHHLVNSRISSAIDGFYEDGGRLFWKNSKGEVFQVTFTKQEVVTNLLTDL